MCTVFCRCGMRIRRSTTASSDRTGRYSVNTERLRQIRRLNRVLILCVALPATDAQVLSGLQEGHRARNTGELRSQTIGESEHMQLTALVRNSHPLHFDEVYCRERSFTNNRGYRSRVEVARDASRHPAEGAMG